MDEKYVCEKCGVEVNEEDFVGLGNKDMWLCQACCVSIIPFSVEGD